MKIKDQMIKEIWATKDLGTKRVLFRNLLAKCTQGSPTIVDMQERLEYAPAAKIDQMATSLLLAQDKLKVLKV